jgi:hypothetical protein
MRIVILNKLKKIVCIVLSCIILIAGISGCSGAKPAATPGATPAANASPAASPNAASKSTPSSKVAATKAPAQSEVKSSPTSTPKKMPKLTDTTFNLTLADGQEYAENPVPIYLYADQTLHLSYMVIRGGDHFHMTFTLPNGNLISITGTGSLSSYLHGESSNEKLTKNGDLVLRPGDNDWGDGYYIFHPQIYKDDTPLTVKLLYWIE